MNARTNHPRPGAVAAGPSIERKSTGVPGAASRLEREAHGAVPKASALESQIKRDKAPR